MPLYTSILWRALQRPPSRNPVFARAYNAPEQPVMWYIGCVQWVGILFFLPILAFPALIYGIGWATGISNLIARERAQGTFDLIRLCPSGPLGMTWAIGTGYLYHHRTFNNIAANSNLYGRVTLVVFALVGFEVSWATFNDGTLEVVAWMVRLVTLAVALILDHRQSLILAGLTGMVAPFLTSERINAQLFAFALYLVAQMGSYFAAVMLGFMILSPLVDALGFTGWFATSVLLCVRLVIFVAARELTIRLLWRALSDPLALAPVEQREFLSRNSV